MLRVRQALSKHSQHALLVVTQESSRIQPQAGKYLRTKDAICAWRILLILAVAQDKPEDLALPQCDHHVLKHAGCFVIALLAVQVVGFGTGGDFKNKLSSASQIIIFLVTRTLCWAENRL